MSPIDALLPALAQVFTIEHLGMLALGVFMGLAVGVLPGLGGIAGLSLILPFAFDMQPTLALALMIGILAPLHTSDTFPAVLMGIPGTSSAQATVVDGFPMSRKGEASRALSAAFSASMIGGIIGAIVLSFAVFGARPLILAMGFGELMMLTVFALSMVGMLTGASPLKGLAACGLGLLVGTIGGAPATGEFRLDLGTFYLQDGLALVIVGLGLFAIPEIVELLRRNQTISDTGKLGAGWIQGILDVIRNRWLAFRCAILGCIIGALPGLGGSVADWITYGHVVQTSKDRSQFGKGDVRGVIGPEAASNSITGGSLIPTLLFGIPGSGSMAILLGGFVLIGIQPGPSMVNQNLDITFVIIWSLVLANILGAGVCFLLAGQVARLTTIPYAMIGSVMIVIIFFGAFQATRIWSDFFALAAFGIIGIYMKRFGWPRPAVLIGFVLSNGLEISFYRVAQVYGWGFLDRPLVLAIIGLTLLSVFSAWKFRPKTERINYVPDLRARLPQLTFTLLILIGVVYAAYDASQATRLARIFPMTVALVTIALILPLLFAQAFVANPRTGTFADSEFSSNTAHGNMHYILWIAGLLGIVSVIGFPLGGAVFVMLLTTVKVGGPWWRNALLALGTLALLVTLSNLLNLYYPTSLLTPYLPRGWG